MKRDRTKAQELRLLLDNLERTAVDAVKALDGFGVDELGLDAKVAGMVPKVPNGLRSWKVVLTQAYEAAKEDQNAPTNDEFHVIQDIETARKARDEAIAAYREALSLCGHRIRLEDPEFNGNGTAKYPDRPTCLICGEEFELEWYCPKSPVLRCEYPNVLMRGNPSEFIYGDDLASANHDGEIECVHCREPWTRFI